jgi:leucyl aminopeptidase
VAESQIKKRRAQGRNMNFLSKPWLSTFQFSTPSKKVPEPTGYAYFLGHEDKATYEKLIRIHGLNWQLEALKKNDKEMVYFSGKKGPVWILKPKEPRAQGHWGILAESNYTWSRDMAGALVGFFKAHQLKSVLFEFIKTSPQQELGALAGFEIASYNFREVNEDKPATLPKMIIVKSKDSLAPQLLKPAQAVGEAVNLARHMVNLPPNELNPTTFQDIVESLDWGKETKVEIWKADRLKKENCNLMLAVGSGSPNKPALIHIRYRPAKSSLQPLAFVGKGITFDTGGLDIKPSSGMRLMKKDMGGAASILALAWWVNQAKIDTPCDFYLALAENSVDGSSYRPSDVIVSRAGLRVEIDNTDAEGRLVLADALDVAASQKGADEPLSIINVATLTGAIKVALGVDVAGLFSNDDGLADQLLNAAQTSGDYLWRMPLVDKYFSGLSSPFADFKNSGDSFGGAITAALFLHKFVRGKKWAHLDIYAWADKASGAIGSSGGSGQAVQCLIEFVRTHK